MTINVEEYKRKDGSLALTGSIDNAIIYWAFVDKPKKNTYKGAVSPSTYEVTVFIDEETYEGIGDKLPNIYSNVKVLSKADLDKAATFSDDDFALPKNKRYRACKHYLNEKLIENQDNQYYFAIKKQELTKDGLPQAKPNVFVKIGESDGVDQYDELPKGTLMGNGSVADVLFYGYVDKEDNYHIYLGDIYVKELVEYEKTGSKSNGFDTKRGVLVSKDKKNDVASNDETEDLSDDLPF